MKHLYKTRNIAKSLYMAFAMVFLVGGSLFAQTQTLPVREVHTDEVWNTDQVLSTSIIVKAGATLYIGGDDLPVPFTTVAPNPDNSDVNVLFNYVDVNGDGVGDLTLTVEDQGRLVINTTGDVLFGPTGTNPNPDSTNHWGGLIFETDLVDLSNATVTGAANAISLTVEGTRFGGATLEGNATGLNLTENNILVAAVSVNGGARPISITGDDVTVQYAEVADATGEAVWIAGNNATINWVNVTGSNLGVQVAGTGAQITNSTFNNGTTGMQVDTSGIVTVNNSTFNNNSGIGITSAGTTSIDNSTIRSNDGIGIDFTEGDFTLLNSTVNNNGSFGVQVADVVGLFNRNNINDNDATGSNIQVNSTATSQSDFNNNWWGVSSRVDTVITETTPGSIDYTDFRMASAFLFNEADLNIDKTLSFDNLVTKSDTAVVSTNWLSFSDDYRYTYTTTGNVAFIQLRSFSGDGDTQLDAFEGQPVGAPIVQPNFGFFDISAHSANADEDTTQFRSRTVSQAALGTAYSEFGSQVFAAFDTQSDAITILDTGTADTTATVAITGNTTNLNDSLWIGGTNARIRWSAPNSVSTVTIAVEDTVADTTPLVIQSGIDASLGFYDWAVPTATLAGNGRVSRERYVLTISDDATSNPVGSATVATNGILPVPTNSPNWVFTPTNNTHTVFFADIDFLNSDLDGPAANTLENEGDLPDDNEIIYVGAFYTDQVTGEIENAGWAMIRSSALATQNLDAIDGTAGDQDSLVITVYGDDSNTIDQDGFRAGQTLQFRVYRESWGTPTPNNALDEFTRILQYGDDPIDGTSSTTITFVAEGITDATPPQLYYREGSSEQYANQANNFIFSTQNLNDEDATDPRVPTNGWFWVSSNLDFKADGDLRGLLGYSNDTGTAAADSMLNTAPVNIGADPALGGEIAFDSLGSDANAVVFTDGTWVLYADGDNDTIGDTLNVSDPSQAGFFHVPDITPGLGVYTTALPGNDNFEMLKNGRGDVYWNIDFVTDDFTNGIVSGVFSPAVDAYWNHLEGYMIRMSNLSATELAYLRFIGSKIDPTTPITLNTGWNLVPNLRGGVDVDDFTRVGQLNIDLAMGSIADPNIIVKDVYGDIYWPAFAINTIEEMRELQAYYVYVTTEDVLKYPADSFVAPATKMAAKETVRPAHYVVGFNSDNSAVVAITKENLSDLPEGAEIGFFNPNGDLVGATVYTGGNVAATLWGESSLQEEGEKGLKPGESFSVRAYLPTTGEEMHLTNMTFAKGSNVYEHNGIAIMGSAELTDELLPTDFGLEQNYPNPFNPSTTINFSLPEASKVTVKVYNVMGQLVSTLVNRDMNAGRHSVNFDASNLASGVYLYRIQAGSFTATRKMNLIK